MIAGHQKGLIWEFIYCFQSKRSVGHNFFFTFHTSNLTTMRLYCKILRYSTLDLFYLDFINANTCSGSSTWQPIFFLVMCDIIALNSLLKSKSLIFILWYFSYFNFQNKRSVPQGQYFRDKKNSLQSAFWLFLCVSFVLCSEDLICWGQIICTTALVSIAFQFMHASGGERFMYIIVHEYWNYIKVTCKHKLSRMWALVLWSNLWAPKASLI